VAPEEVSADTWEGHTAGSLALGWGAPAVHLYDRLGSTNEVARRLGSAGAPTGTVVLSEYQSAGRGRLGRVWESPPGAGLWLSIVVRSDAVRDIPALPLLVGLAAAGCVDPWIAPQAVGLKWPNDLLAGERKIGGILCEAVWQGTASPCVIVGIGINVSQRPDEFPHTIRSRATSLANLRGSPVDRAALAACLVRSILDRAGEPLAMSEAELAEMARRDVLAGRPVTVVEPATGTAIAAGTAQGIAPDGALLLRDSGGELRSIRSGSIVLG
jgi:BirA family transcriptional regulator, biotin operon repressor / biotin---[acetyl-CoA-carboxylase] ligase